MKHFSLKFKLSRCVILKYLVLKFAIFGIIIPLNGFAQGASSELTKEIDFSSAVTRITQKYEYWCVYACLESLNTSLPQCTHCFNFLHRFYMNGASNPYQLVSDEDFKDAITLQIFMRNLVSLESPWMHIFCLKGFQNLVW